MDKEARNSKESGRVANMGKFRGRKGKVSNLKREKKRTVKWTYKYL